MDFRIGMPLTGAAAPPKLAVKIIGTAASSGRVIKNNQQVHRLKAVRNEVAFEYLDNASQPGESYYYVCVEQSDGQLAWSSPIWIKRR